MPVAVAVTVGVAVAVALIVAMTVGLVAVVVLAIVVVVVGVVRVIVVMVMAVAMAVGVMVPCKGDIKLKQTGLIDRSLETLGLDTKHTTGKYTPVETISLTKDEEGSGPEGVTSVLLA